MSTADIILWTFLIGAVVITCVAWAFDKRTIERFVDGVDTSAMIMQARDSAPTTSEMKNHYKSFLLYVNDKLTNNNGSESSKTLCIVRTLGTKLFGRNDVRSTFTYNDIMSPWPTWLPPIDPTIRAPVYTATDAQNSRNKILAYLKRYFGRAEEDDTGTTVRNLYTDIGQRFFFEQGETVTFQDDFDPRKLTNDVPKC